MIRWLRLSRLWWVAVLAVVLLLLGAISFTRRVEATEPVIGVEWTQSSMGPLAVSVDPAGEAWAAGLREGDLLVAVDGSPVRNALEAGEIPWNARSPESFTLSVRNGGSQRVLTLTPAFAARDEPYTYLAIVGLAFWLSGAFIVLRWPTVRGGAVYVGLAACMFVQFAFSHTGRASGLDWAIFWSDLVAGAFVPALMIHLGLALTKRTMPWARMTSGLAYGFSSLLVLVAIWLSPAGLGGAYRWNDPSSALIGRDRVEMLFLGISVLITLRLFLKSYTRSSSLMHRSQMRWLLWGLTIGMGPFVVLYAFPWGLGAPDLPSWARFLAVMPVLCVPATFTAALARYRLHDLDLILLRGLSEVTAIVFTFAVLSASIFLLREGVGELIPLSRSATRYGGFLIAAVSYPQLRLWVKRGIDRAFYRQRYSYRATLLDWARELNAETDLTSLAEHLRDRIRKTLGVPIADVLVRTGTWRFDSLDHAPTIGPVELDEASLEQLESQTHIAVEPATLPGVPWARYLFAMKVKDNLRAVLAIAERESPEEALTTEDRALLSTLAAHAGTAIEAARLVAEVRRRADEIERLHGRQERILESSAVGLLLLDEEGRILAWNRALEGIYDLPRAQAIGHRLGEVFPLHVARRIEQERQNSAPQEESRIFRLTMNNRGARRVVANISISPADDAAGCVVTFDDVSERVKLEEQVLQQERLASLGLLAAGVAHEINTPLTGISSYAQLMLEENPEDDPRNELLSKICTQTQRASSITNSLLTLARPEKTVFESMDVNSAVEEVLQLFDPQIRGRGMRLTSLLEDGVSSIRGHRGKLQQVLLNLLLNARDAVGEVPGGGEIRLATLTWADCVVIEIEDNGVGIADEDLPRIFDPFFTTKGRGKGSGLGLSITYGIVQEHGGKIHASCDERGTKFRIELPAWQSSRALA